MALHYNYVFFNSLDGSLWKDYPNGYFTICVEDLLKMDGVKVVSAPLDYAITPIRFLYALHNSKRLRLPLKKIWYPLYFRNDFKENKPLCFVYQDVYSLEYIQYLKKKYPDAKHVKISRDLISTQLPFYEKFNKIGCFDIWMSFDEGDSEKYGMPYFSEIESKTNVNCSKNHPKYDVFFAGRAKDRLPRLLKAYDILTAGGCKCFFYITGAEGEKPQREGIVYADNNMSYREMLIHSVNSKCLLEINQGNATGYTSRFLEAVIYGIKLITDNVNIKNSIHYNPKYMQVIENVDEISAAFVKQDVGVVDYHYQNQFSPVLLIEQIDGLLTNPSKQ